MYLHVREYIHVIKTGNEWAGLKFNTKNVWYIQYMWITGIFGGELNLMIWRLQVNSQIENSTNIVDALI